MKKNRWQSSSGIELAPSYQSPQAPGEVPGEFPYTRGIRPQMYREKLWTMRQYAGFSSAQETNARYHYLLKQGTTGLSVAFDLPTQMGRDSDHELSRGEVGRVGVPISCVEDMEALLAGIPLDQVSISMTINATAPILLAYLLIDAERRGTPWSVLSGTVQNDVLKEYIARGTFIYPPKQAVRLTTDLIAFCNSQVPKWNTISVSGYHIREAGSTAVQEVAFTLANAIEYVSSIVARGLSIDSIGERLTFFFNCHTDFFEEIAKFRAARRLWARIMRERFGATNARAVMMRFHTQTAGSSLTAQQPLNNIARTAFEALAAVLGGTQSLHTNGYDEALGLPTEQAATVALRTQQILAHETGVAAVADPLGGSFLVEHLTNAIEQQSSELIEKIQAQGGMLAAIEANFPQEEIERAAYQFQREVENGERIIVGVNQFVDEAAKEIPVQRIYPEGEQKQCARLKAMRTTRNAGQVSAALERLKQGCQGNDNLMELIVQAARSGATLGEMADVMRSRWGEYGHELSR